MKAWPRITTLAVRSVLSPRIGLSLAFRGPWSHSTRLFSYWPVLCNAAGIKPLDGVGQSRCPVGDHLARVTVNSQGGGEERARGGGVSSLRDVHVDHLLMLVDRPVEVGPDPRDLDVGLVDKPPIPGQVPSRPGRVDQQRGELLHPPIERDVVDLDATL